MSSKKSSDRPMGEDRACFPEQSGPGGAPLPTLTLIGAGRLGRALGQLWFDAGLVKIQDVLTRTPASARSAVLQIGAGHAVEDYKRLSPATFFLIATPDSALTTVADRLAETGILAHPGVVFHCSGAESTAVLAAARAAGAEVASAHPLSSFVPGPVAAGRLSGVACAIEGEPRARRLVTGLFEGLGAHCFVLEPGQKLLYHAAAVLGSNYVVTLIGAALEACGLAGIGAPDARAMLEPLVRLSVHQAFASGAQAALTGPVARGDVDLVVREYQALRLANGPLARIYRDLARSTARLAGRDDPLAGQESEKADGS